MVLRDRQALDLLDQRAVAEFFNHEDIDQVYLAAAKVGGIHANDSYPADFIAENLAIQQHVIGEAHRAGVERLLFLGSSCIYPRNTEQPMKEEQLLTGPLEPTNEPYAIAKIQSLWTGRQFSRAKLTRPARFVKAFSRGNQRRQFRNHDLGHGNTQAGISTCR